MKKIFEGNLYRYRLFIIVSGFLLLSQALMASGRIKGFVTDSLTANVLAGANLVLEGTALGQATDLQGAYTIFNVPEGSYTMKVSYIGYAEKILSVNIANNQILTINVALNSDVIQGQEVVITGQFIGQAAAINQQVSSNTIVNVISEEKIQELPDANAAEAIGRLPGVSVLRTGGEASRIVLRGLSDQYSSISIDGIRIAATDVDNRGVDLSTISQGSLAGIELHKVLTSDKDADAIAGSVNMVTKKAPEKRLLRLDSKGAYSDLEQSASQYDLGFRYGERFWKNLLGIQVTANAEQRIRSREFYDIDANLNLNNWSNWEISDLSLYYTDENRKRYGGGLMLDITTPDDGTIRFNNIYNFTERDYVEYYRNYPNGDDVEYSIRDREQQIGTFNSYLQGDNNILGLKLNWGLSYAKSSTKYPYDNELNFVEPSALGANNEIISGMNPVPTGFKGPVSNLVDYSLNNFEKAYLFSGFNRTQKASEKDYNFFLNLAREYTVTANITGEWKMGAKSKAKARKRSDSEMFAPYYNVSYCLYEKSADGTIQPKDFTDTFLEDMQTEGGKVLLVNFLKNNPRSRNLFDLYRLYPLIEQDALRELYQMGRHGVSDVNGSLPEYYENLEPAVEYYDITERIQSAYLMNTLKFGQSITWIAGLRVESEDNEYKTKFCPTELSGFPVPSGPILDTAATHKETLFLPNTHVNFKLTDFMSLRAAAYRALARPDFSDRLPNFVARRQGTFYSGNNFTFGNPDLEAAKAWNYELNASFYGKNIGLFSVSGFYKKIDDMYHMMNGLVFQGRDVLDSLNIAFVPSFVAAGQAYSLFYPYNSTRDTKVWGVEIEHQADLRFLPGFLKNIVVSYNFSFVHSETYIPQVQIDTTYYTVVVPILGEVLKEGYIYSVEETRQKLEDQPEVFGNLAIGYDIAGFSCRLSLFHQGEFYRSYSPSRRSDLLQNDYTRLDLAIKQKINDKISLMLNINNLTDTAEKTTLVDRIGDRKFPNYEEKFGLSATLGVRLEL
ncbi:MAG: TonB-dependent receptor [Candidatus Marinimicrobia bacterium]|nr:TonB-dependent receptor [Candidatus Neomarinimicrobiota bacterium]